MTTKLDDIARRESFAIEAAFSEDRAYRYWWKCKVSEYNKWRILWVMLNPSTADEYTWDPTINRVMQFSKREHYGIVEVVNLFALRSTDPKQLYKSELDPIGPDNDDWIKRRAALVDGVILAWGSHGDFRNRGDEVYRMLKGISVPVWHLGTTKRGLPRHPLYLGKDTKLISC